MTSIDRTRPRRLPYSVGVLTLLGAFSFVATLACDTFERTPGEVADLEGTAPSEQLSGTVSPTPTTATQPGPNAPPSAMVSVHVFDTAGRLVGPLSVPEIERSDAEWRELLSDEQFRILRSSGTERAFCGTLLDNKKEGVYACAGCGLPLFASDSKFKSGTGWPSFFQPIAPGNVAELVDKSHGMVRTEINCARCAGHLGHVFEDGPPPTGLRFCLNSESLNFTEADRLAELADPAATGASATDSAAPETATLVFAGGCFWCVEAVFEELAGVREAISGYAGGSADTANYRAVCSGTTGHAEAVRITYEPAKISYEQLLRVHLATHDPTTLNRQGADVGTQYRSAIFYADETEKRTAERILDEAARTGAFSKPIVTTLEPLGTFYPAESSHQNYVCLNPNQGYVQSVAWPKVKKVREKFSGLLKETSPLER